MIISIPDSVLENAGVSTQALAVEIAAYLYQKELLTIGQARKIAGLDLISFQKELAKRDINIHYSIEDFEKDLENLKQYEGRR